MSNLVLEGLNLNMEKEDSQETSLQPVTVNQVTEFTNKYKLQLREEPEVQQLISKLNVVDANSIITFGADSAQNVTKISDSLLHSIKAVNQEQAGEVLVQLTKIMDKFDIADFEKTKEPGFIEKMFKKVKNSVDLMLQKYDNLGKEVDQIYMILKKYENDLEKDTNNLKLLQEANVQYYQQLEKYIVAGEMALEELDNEHIPKYEQLVLETNDAMAQTNLNTLKDCRDMLDARVYDLRLAENVAIQSMPMISSMRRGNFDLARTIKSSFIITLPVFRQCLIQAVQLKRQELMAKNIEALRETTNELLVRNAENTAKQGIMMANMAGRGAVDIDKLEQSFTTIVNGIKEAKLEQEKNALARSENSKRLEEFKFKALTEKV